MKAFLYSSLILLLLFCQNSYASTPTESLEVAVNKLLLVAADKTSTDEIKKEKLSKLLAQEIDFETVSKRVVSKTWRKATDEQKSEFKKLFLGIMTDTYFLLLKNYSNEKVLFLKEQLKSTKTKEYAIVDTKIISGNKKIPVRYRMIKIDNIWKIYDFIPEGISLLTTYKNNYSTLLRKEGMAGLLADMGQIKK